MWGSGVSAQVVPLAQRAESGHIAVEPWGRPLWAGSRPEARRGRGGGAAPAPSAPQDGAWGRGSGWGGNSGRHPCTALTGGMGALRSAQLAP